MQRDAFHCLQSRLGMGADNVGSGGWSWLRRTFASRHLGVWKRELGVCHVSGRLVGGKLWDLFVIAVY